MTDKRPRNIRNNNPGNIRLTSDRWRGQVLPSPDRSFAVFKSPEWGYRALFVVLEGYMLRHGLRTIRGIIGRYAPPNENSTGSYVRNVCRSTGWGPDDPLEPCGRVLQDLVRAIVLQEGGTPADEEAMMAGYRLYERGAVEF